MSDINTKRGCGSQFCKTSTGIHGGITCGDGGLDANGFWERPCRPCAMWWDQEHKESIPKEIANLIEEHKGMTAERAEAYLKSQHEWFYLPAWPYSEQE